MEALDDAAMQEQQIRTALIGKAMDGEGWTREECEAAVSSGLATREQADAFFALVEELHRRGYEPWLRGGMRCEGVLIEKFPRTADGGYVIPSMLRGVCYRGRGMEYVDRQAGEGRYYTRWIGKHCVTGELVAHTDRVYGKPGYEGVWVE